jgi:hypothetical protein
MKRVFLYLAAVAALITVGGAAYIIFIKEQESTAADKWDYTIGHLDEIGRTKDEGSRLAAHYAEIAAQEQQHRGSDNTAKQQLDQCGIPAHHFSAASRRALRMQYTQAGIRKQSAMTQAMGPPKQAAV